MFGFSRVDGLNRKEWNTRVRNLLENRFEIVTNHQLNPSFPGILVFGQLLDEGWHQKACPEDAAVYVALIYWSGKAKAGRDGSQEARQLVDSITDFILEIAMSGKVSEARSRQFIMFVDQNSWHMDE